MLYCEHCGVDEKDPETGDELDNLQACGIIYRMKNNKHRVLLRELKERYNFTWTDVAGVFGRSRREIEDWAGGLRNIPDPFRTLLEIYTEYPKMFRKYRSDAQYPIHTC